MADQKNLFEDEEDWRSEWRNMPEFVMDDLTSFRKITVHFACQEDVVKFAELIGQTITPKQKALWYPPKEPRRYADKVYIDEPR